MQNHIMVKNRMVTSQTSIQSKKFSVTAWFISNSLKKNMFRKLSFTIAYMYTN